MKKTARRLSSLFLVLTVITSLAAAALAPLFATPTVAQTNPQTTDIFTGQFIPAYFGAAYDPSEAFKQMAGLPVYVFAYDTWGTVVNNFAYKTQIKADGSFQAAGLPNASHYGVCFGISDTDYLNYFRAPLPEDGIQSAFAYSQATFSANTNINTQIADKPVNLATINGGGGCRVFLTSSRQVDISNHVNIFPLVPTSILSVIITDQSAGTTDYFNSNKPYEIYAQRVVINNAPSSEIQQSNPGGTPCLDAACQAAQNQALSQYNSVAVGPVIRGRSIPYTPTAADGTTTQGNGTIFQAFAPRGIYAITYWRPDSRSSNAKMTYLTYDGISQLDTPYNGVAIEEVEYPTTNNWQQLSTRSASEAGNQAWVAKPYTINAWGMTTRGVDGKVVPQLGIQLQVSDNQVGFVDIFNRDCATGGQSHTSSADGLYLLSSACGSARSGSNGDPSLGGSIKTSITARSGSSGNNFIEQAGVSLQINGKQGPSRRDISLSNIPNNSTTGVLQRDGMPFAFANIDLLVNGKLHKKVAQTDSTGFFFIPESYFNNNPYTKYEIKIQPSYDNGEFGKHYENTFALDNSQVLAAKNSTGADLGTIAINKRQSSNIESFLAGLNLQNIMATLRFPTAYAQQKINTPDGEDAGTLNLDTTTPWKFEIDLEALGTTRNFFNLTNYKLRHVEINPPTQGLEIGSISSDYEYFARGEDTEDSKDGAWLIGTSDEKDSLQIKGVQLEYKDPESLGLAQRFKDLNTPRLSFNLHVRFEYKGEATPRPATDVDGQPVSIDEDTVDGQQDSVGQTDGFPRILEATWPVDIEAVYNGSDIQSASITSFNVRYSPIVLDIAYPNCGGGSLMKDGIVEVFQGLICKTVIGGINGVKSAINFMADKFLTVDPLNYPGAGVVVKYWNVIRNLVNSFAVLILLIAGVAIMLQYEPTTYNLQSVLKKLIIAVVLVNFSILVIQIAVDIANVLALGGYYMLNNIFEPDSSGLANINAAIGALSASLITMLAAAVASGFTGFMALIVFLGAIIILLLYVCWKIFIQYFFRLVTLWICIILAPAAFAARVLPGTASYFGKWKNILVGALVAQAALALMLGLSLAMIVAVRTADTGTEAFISVIASFALLYMATKVPNKAAAMMGTDLAGSLEGRAISGFGTAREAWKNARIARRQNKWKNEQRENQLGIGKDKRTENRLAKEEELKAAGVGRMGRLIRGRTFAAGQKAAASVTMTEDAYNRKAREMKRTGGFDYIVSGVRGSDLDTAEDEAYKAAYAMHEEEQGAKYPHKYEDARNKEFEGIVYKEADSTAGVFSRAKLTGARENINLVDGQYGYTLDNLDAAGNIKKQTYTDSTGATQERLQTIGDLSDFDRGENASVYAQGFKKVFDDQVEKLSTDEDKAKAQAAIERAKNWIRTAPAGSRMQDNFKGFFENFEYGAPGQKGVKAWASFYQDLGENINPDIAKFPDVYGKVTEDFVFKAAGKGDSAWEASLRTATSQAKSGISSRTRIKFSDTQDLHLPTFPTGVPAANIPALRLASMPPANQTITGNELKNALDAIKNIKQAYADLTNPAVGQRIQDERAYKNAVTTLRRLGYGVVT